MIKYENECVGCYLMGLPCMGVNCSNLRVHHYYCDKCKKEDRLFHFDGEELCAECIVKEVATETDEYEYDEGDVYNEYARVEGS